jgi:hypothetical protein
MKSGITVFAAAVFFTSSAAHSQSTQSGAPGNPGTVPQSTATAPPAQWAPSSGNAAVDKTRAQVDQEHVEARRSGEIDHRNQALYAHH